MKSGAKFVHWMGDNYELHAQYNLPDGRTVGIHTLETEDWEIPFTPTHQEWLNKITKKEKCVHCYKTIRTHYDLNHHMSKVHGRSVIS